VSEHPFPIRAHERKRLELMGVTIVAAGGWSASYPCQNADWARGSRERHQPHDRRRRRGARRSRARARRPDDLTRRWQIVQHRPGSRSVGSATGFRRPGVQRRLGVRPCAPGLPKPGCASTASCPQTTRRRSCGWRSTSTAPRDTASTRTGPQLRACCPTKLAGRCRARRRGCTSAGSAWCSSATSRGVRAV